MFEESVAEAAQGFGDAAAQVFEDALAGFVRFGAPDFEDAVGGLAAVRGGEASGVGGEPEGGEVGVEFFAEDEVEVGFDGGAAGEAGVVAQDAQLRAVGDDAPQAAVFGIEVFLHQAVGRLAAARAAEMGVGGVEAAVARGQQQGRGAAAGAVGEFEDAVVERGALGRGQVGVAEDLAQQRLEPIAHADLFCAEAEAAAAGGVAGVQIAGDAPVAGDFVFDRERFREAVIGAGLTRRLEFGDFAEEFRRQDAARGAQRREAAAFSREGHVRLTAPPRA